MNFTTSFPFSRNNFKETLFLGTKRMNKNYSTFLLTKKKIVILKVRISVDFVYAVGCDRSINVSNDIKNSPLRRFSQPNPQISRLLFSFIIQVSLALASDFHGKSKTILIKKMCNFAFFFILHSLLMYTYMNAYILKQITNTL